MDFEKSDLDWLITKLEKSSERYMNAENFILSLSKIPWYKRFFYVKKY